MKDYERTKQLEDIITNIERTSSTRLNEKRFNRKHLNQYGRQLINTFEVQYKVKEKVGQKIIYKFVFRQIADRILKFLFLVY